MELKLTIDPEYEEAMEEPFQLSRLEPQGFSPAVTKLTVATQGGEDSDEDEQPTCNQLDLGDTNLNKLTTFVARVAAVSGGGSSSGL